MATSAERTKGLRERERRGLRRFTVPVSEDDLRVIAALSIATGRGKLSSHVRNALLATVGAKKAACREGPTTD
jgi:hypothetical protein